ncbi:MAG: hypothetical protein HOQ44_12820 [Nocardia sp.]|nr:hypothetical protein [Nocardia sp.]
MSVHISTTVRKGFGVLSGVVVALIIAAGPANAVRISDCVDGGGIVVRCSEQPVTREDKIVCPTPGKATRIWCVGGFYNGLEILEAGDRSRYGVPQ